MSGGPAAAMEARVRHLLADVLPRRELALGLNATDSLRAAGLDSLRLMQLITAIEDGLGIRLDDDDLQDRHFATLSALAALLAGKPGGGAP